MHGRFLRPIEGNMAGDATKDLAIVRPVQDTGRVLHGQRVVVHVRVVNRGSFLVADRLVV